MPTFDIFSELELTRQSFETTRIHFKSDVFFFFFFAAFAVVDANTPYLAKNRSRMTMTEIVFSRRNCAGSLTRANYLVLSKTRSRYRSRLRI